MRNLEHATQSSVQRIGGNPALPTACAMYIKQDRAVALSHTRTFTSAHRVG